MQNREYLKGFVDKYIKALEKKDFSEIPVSDAYKYSENCELIRLGEGIITYPVKETVRLEIYSNGTLFNNSISNGTLFNNSIGSVF